MDFINVSFSSLNCSLMYIIKDSKPINYIFPLLDSSSTFSSWGFKLTDYSSKMNKFKHAAPNLFHLALATLFSVLKMSSIGAGLKGTFSFASRAESSLAWNLVSVA